MHYVSCRDFFVKHQITQVTQAPYRPNLEPCNFCLFPKTKIIFEREDISDHPWNSWKYDGVADSDWKNCMRSQGTYFEGDRDIIVLCIMFLYLASSSINVSIFHITWLDTFWTDPVYGKQMPELNCRLHPGDPVNSIGRRWGLKLNTAFPMWLKTPKAADHTDYSWMEGISIQPKEGPLNNSSHVSNQIEASQKPRWRNPLLFC